MRTRSQQLDRARRCASPRSGPGAGSAARRSACRLRMTGSSEVIGSWKIIEMALPRMRRISALGEPDELAAAQPDAAFDSARAASGTRPMMESAVTLLPQPDSPTTPRISPRVEVQLTPSTARTTPSAREKPGAQVLDGEQRFGRCSRAATDSAGRCASGHSPHMRRAKRGSSMSRKPSPIRLIASTVAARSKPGVKMIQGASRK